MSVIAIEKDGVVYLGFDAVKQRGDVKIYAKKESNLSVHKMKNGILVCSFGFASVAQQMWVRDEWFELAEDEEFDKEFIVTKIIPKFYEEIKTHKEWSDDYGVRNIETGFLMVYKGEMYAVFGDLSVKKFREIICFSNNDEELQLYAYARGYMENHPSASPNEVIMETFKFAAPLNKFINTHGYLINTKDLEFKEMGIK